MEFVGTAAWFFLIVNLSKVPFSASLGLISLQSLALNVVLIPFIAAGVFSGRWLLRRVNQSVFEWLMIGLSAIGALRMAL
jgi:uncharacterized membrane protein YfcA